MRAFVWAHFTKLPFYTVNTNPHLLRDVKLKRSGASIERNPSFQGFPRQTRQEGAVNKLLTGNVPVDT